MNCPRCGRSSLLPIAYGKTIGPLPEGVKEGGCVVGYNAPAWSCTRCGLQGTRRTRRRYSSSTNSLPQTARAGKGSSRCANGSSRGALLMDRCPTPGLDRRRRSIATGVELSRDDIYGSSMTEELGARV